MTAIAAVRQTWIMTTRELRHWRREPWVPIFSVLFSVMLVLMFGYLLGGAITIPGGGDYLSYLLPGVFALSMMFGIETTMSAVADDSKKGITERFRSLPIHGAAVPFGRAGADLLNSVLQLAVLVGGGLLIGWRMTGGIGPALLAVVLLLWLRVAMLVVGVFLGLVIRGEGGVMAVQVLVWPVGFLSNAFVAPQSMPTWLGALAQWNPLSATAAACRELFGNPTGATVGPVAEHPVLLAVLWPAAVVVVFAPFAARAYRRLSL